MSEVSVKTVPLEQTVRSVAKRAHATEVKIVPTVQLVIFKLDHEEYAVTITDLKEIIRIPEIIAIPGTPNFVKGIINLRGQIVMVVDVEKRFHLKRTHELPPKHVVIADIENSLFGLVVDEVTDVLRVSEEDIKPAPHFASAKINQDYLKGVVVLSGEETEKKANESYEETEAPDRSKKDSNVNARLILLLDLQKILSEEELLDFGKTIQVAATRTQKKSEI